MNAQVGRLYQTVTLVTEDGKSHTFTGPVIKDFNETTNPIVKVLIGNPKELPEDSYFEPID